MFQLFHYLPTLGIVSLKKKLGILIVVYCSLILVFICIKLMKWYSAPFAIFISCLNTFCCVMPVQIFCTLKKGGRFPVLFLLICKRFLHMVLGRGPILERSDPHYGKRGKRS